MPYFGPQIISATYETDDGKFWAIRVSTGVLSAQHTQVISTAVDDVTVKVTKRRNAYGIKPRGFYVKFAEAVGAPAYIHRKFFPVMTPTDIPFFAQAKHVVIDNIDWLISSYVGERIR